MKDSFPVVPEEWRNRSGVWVSSTSIQSSMLVQPEASTPERSIAVSVATQRVNRSKWPLSMADSG